MGVKIESSTGSSTIQPSAGLVGDKVIDLDNLFLVSEGKLDTLTAESLTIGNTTISSSSDVTVVLPIESSKVYPLSLTNGWVDYVSSFTAPSYYKSAGIVTLQGLIKNGTLTTGTLVATLPVGFRPSKRLICTVHASSGPARLDVLANGQIVTNSGWSASWTSIVVSFMAIN